MEKVLPQFVKVNLDLVKTTLVPEIGNLAVQNIVKSTLDKLVETSYLLVDENPNNKEQVVTLWSNFTTTPQVASSFESLFLQAIAKIEDPTIKSSLLTILPEIVKTLQAVTDGNSADGKQIEVIWKDFAKSPKFIDLIFQNVGLILSKLNLPEWLINWVNRLIKR